jgi:adenylyl-sulfate kinase
MERFDLPLDRLSAAERSRLPHMRPVTLWLTGLPGAGKTTLAYALERRLMDASVRCHVLDGDDLRDGLSRDLGFSAADRRENVRRAAEVARLMNEAGLAVIVALVSPAREDREMAHAVIGEAFREVHVSTALEICQSRDPKGLYAKARRGEIAEFTGVSAPYEPPEAPALALDAGTLDVEACVERLLALARPVSPR